MENKLKKAIAISAKVRKLIKAKVQIAEIISDLSPIEAVISPSLITAQNDLLYEILMLKRIIFTIVSGLPGYDVSRHLVVDYFSEADLKTGYIDLAIADIDTDYLDLSTGDILPPDKVPYEMRNLSDFSISEEVAVGDTATESKR
jgi:hypothetical protein